MRQLDDNNKGRILQSKLVALNLHSHTVAGRQAAKATKPDIQIAICIDG